MGCLQKKYMNTWPRSVGNRLNRCIISFSIPKATNFLLFIGMMQNRNKYFFKTIYSHTDTVHSYRHSRLTWAGTLDWVNDGNGRKTSTTCAPRFFDQPLTKYILCEGKIDMVESYHINWLWPSDAIWRHIWVNTGLVNVLLPDSPKPFPEPMLTNHQ